MLSLLTSSVERSTDSSAKPMFRELGLPERIHFIIAAKILGQSWVNARIIELSSAEFVFRNSNPPNLEWLL